MRNVHLGCDRCVRLSVQVNKVTGLDSPPTAARAAGTRRSGIDSPEGEKFPTVVATWPEPRTGNPNLYLPAGGALGNICKSLPSVVTMRCNP